MVVTLRLAALAAVIFLATRFSPFGDETIIAEAANVLAFVALWAGLDFAIGKITQPK